MNLFRIGEKKKGIEERSEKKEKGIVFIPSITGQSYFTSSVAETATMGPHVHIAARLSAANECHAWAEAWPAICWRRWLDHSRRLDANLAW